MARILLADDEEAVRAYIRRVLEALDHHVVEARDGGEALERLALSEYDLLLTDIAMPVMDGIALALKTTSQYPDMPVLLMTGYSAERQRAHNLDILIRDVLLKPFTLDQLTNAVRTSLAAAPKGADAPAGD